MRRILCLSLLCSLVASGCTFRILGVPLDDIVDDGGGSGDNDLASSPPDLVLLGDLAGADLSNTDDLSTVDGASSPDLADVDLAGADLTELPDLVTPADFTGTTVDTATPPADMVIPPDMTPPIVPSHVGSKYIDPAAIDLSGITEIDTMNLTLRLDGGPPEFAPAGTAFQIDPGTGLAVFTVGALAIDEPLKIIGNRGLVIVASGAVVISDVVSANAVGTTPAPGAVSGGSGAGGNGQQGWVNQESGGGGAGHQSDGAVGGPSPNMSGGAAGKSYGPTSADFLGGSTGGTGGRRNDDCTTSVGGGGGGAFQITSLVSITVTDTGGVNTGGGGGGAGCGNPRQTAGGGGGSGGITFLEAPTIAVAGKLASNGGGGGSGGGNNQGGNVGSDGTLSSTPTPGGASKGDGSGEGGTGGAGISLPVQPGTKRNAGGGGGAAGYIYLRIRGGAPSYGVNNVISPGPIVDTTL